MTERGESWTECGVEEGGKPVRCRVRWRLGGLHSEFCSKSDGKHPQYLLGMALGLERSQCFFGNEFAPIWVLFVLGMGRCLGGQAIWLGELLHS